MKSFMKITLALIFSIFALTNALYQDYEQEKLAKRAVNNVRVYVYSKLNSCSSPSAAVGNYCGTDFSTPTLTLSEKEALVLGSIFTHTQVELQSGIKCANYFKQIKCNATFPQCSSDRTTLTYVNISNLCAQFRSECSNTSNVPAECTYHRPSEPKSVYNLSACIKPTSALHFHGNDCPPRPKDLTIPEWFNDDRSQLQVIAIHVPDTLRSNSASESCIKKVLSYGCHEIPFCSADRTELLSAGNQQNCQKALTCVPSSILQFTKGSIKCSAFPNATAPTTTIPANMGYVSSAVTSFVHKTLLLTFALLICLIV